MAYVPAEHGVQALGDAEPAAEIDPGGHGVQELVVDEV
jgi:hypothetical protein